MAEEKSEMASRLDGSMRALSLIQKLMGRADGAEIFAEFDTDGDGSISREELRLGFKKLGEELSESDLDAIMTLVDADGDGSMNYAEFVQTGKMTNEVASLRQSMMSEIVNVSSRLGADIESLQSHMSREVGELGADMHASLTELRQRVDIHRLDPNERL